MKHINIFVTLILIISYSNAKSILNLGHTTEIVQLNSSENFLASQDSWNYWAVWNLNTKQQILSGYLDTNRTWPKVALKNDVFIVPIQGGFNVYALPNITPHYVEADSIDSLQLTSNGGFIWSGSNTSLRVWNTNGQQVLRLKGNYLRSKIAADSSKLFVAVTGADSLVVFTLSNSNDRSSLHFSGAFHSWFLDGNRFLTQQGSIVRTYSTTGARESMQDIGQTNGLSGNGSYFWTYSAGIPDYNVNIYKVGTSNAPVKTIQASVLTTIIGCNGYIGILPYGVDSFSICKLDPDSITVSVSKGSGAYLSCFDCNSQGLWFTGNQSGVINYGSFGQSPQFLNYGRIRALSSTPGGKLAVATSTGQILIFQINNGTSILIDSFAHNSSSLMFSSDGTRLASGSNSTDHQYNPDRSLFLFDLINHSTIRQWNYSINLNSSYSFVQDFDLSKNGLVVSQMIGTYISNITYSAAKYDISSGDSMHFQQSNYQIAPQLNSTGTLSAHWIDSTVKVYKDNVLINAFSGSFGGWYNDSQFIINEYKDTATRSGTFKNWIGTFLVDTSGKLDSTLHFSKEIFKSTAVSDSELFCADYISTNEPISSWSILNLHSGKRVFSTNTLSKYAWYSIANAIGSDYIVYQNSTDLNLINWRQNQSAIHLKSKPSFKRNNITINNETITMLFTLKKTSPVSLSLLTLNGALVSSVDLGSFNCGDHHVSIPQNAVFRNTRIVHNPLIAIVKTGHSILERKLCIFR